MITKDYEVFFVDNMLDDPDSMRQSALSSGFGTWHPSKGAIGPEAFEGVNFYGDHHVGYRAMMKHIKARIIPNKQFFRVTTKNTEQAVVHSDIFTGDATCLIYLHHEENSGTEFYRHKPTGLYAMPPLKQLYADQKQFDMFKADCKHRDPDIWEKIKQVDAKYNRAVFFPSPVFHCRFPYSGFGDSPETGRMIWGAHFYIEGFDYK